MNKKFATLIALIALPLFVSAQLTVSITTQNITCYSMCNGSATAAVSGGTPPYTYAWTPPGATTATVTNLCAGNYTVTVTDNLANTATATCVITAPPALTAAANATPPSSCSACDGIVNVAASGGVGAYTYCWNSPCICPTQTCNSVCAGNYTVVVTDANGCTATAATVVSPPTTLTVSVNNSTGPGVCAGTSVNYTPTVTGGTGPYTYSWTLPGGSPSSSTAQNPTTTYNTSGTYTTTLTVQDASGCTGSGNMTMTVSPNPTITITPPSPTICAGNSITLNASGATTYVWYPGSLAGPSPIVTPPTTTTYTVTGTSPNGCVGTATVTVVVSPAPVGGSISGATSGCPGSTSGTLTVSGYSGNIVRWEFSTDGGLTWVNVANTSSTYSYNNLTTTTIYRVRVQSASCPAVYSSTATVTVFTPPTITVSEIPSSCNQSDGVLTASGGNTYAWMPGALVGTTISNQPSGITFTVTGTDANGCTGTATLLTTDSCDYVWPGDANDDAVADNIDILDIGIANGAIGTTRANASTTWIGQPSAPWGQTLLSGTDYKWVDCDGNGVIDPVDTQAVVMNYGSVHNNRLAAPAFSSVGPDISIAFFQDTIPANGLGTMNLYLGSASNPANNVYGLAFRLNYDATEISTPSFSMFGAATWFGSPGVDLMRVVLHPNASMGYVDVAITRLDHQDVSGQGYVGSFHFLTTNTEVGTGNYQTVPFSITNVVLVNSTGAGLPINSATGDTIEVCDPPLITSALSQQTNQVSVYPNPANQNIQIEIPSGGTQLVTIEDLSGRVVYSQNHDAGTSSISVATIPAGVYVLRIADKNGNSSMEKITIAH